MCCPEGMVLGCCWSRTQRSWSWLTFELPTCVLHVLAASTQCIVRARWVVGSLSFRGIDFVSDFDDSNLVLQPIADALVAATQYGSLGCLSFDFFGCKRSEETCRFTRVESGPPSSFKFGSWDHCRHAGARCVRFGQPRGNTEHETHCQEDNEHNSGKGYPNPPHTTPPQPTKARPQLSACVCKRTWTLFYYPTPPHPTPPDQSPTPAQCVCLQAKLNVITPPHPTKARPQLSACVCKWNWIFLPHPTPPNQSPTPAQCVCLQAKLNVIPPNPVPCPTPVT